MEGLISVILCNYNYGNYIAEAIESVIRQTYHKWELIIVDDGSTDESRTVIMNYIEKYPNKIKTIYQPNKGQGAGFNAAFAISAGDPVAFLDSDDTWREDKLEKIEKLHRRYDFVGHGKDNGKSYNPPYMGHENQRSLILKEYGIALLCGVTTTSMSFARHILQKILPVPEEGFRVCADEYVMLYALYMTNLYYLDEPLANYRIHENNAIGEKKSEWEIRRINTHIQMAVNKVLMNRGLFPIPYENIFLLEEFIKHMERFEMRPGQCVIYGAGQGGQRVKRLLELFGVKILYFADSNPEKWGQRLEGVELVSPMVLVDRKGSYDKIIIASTWYREIENSLPGLGFRKYDDFVTLHPELVFLPDSKKVN